MEAGREGVGAPIPGLMAPGELRLSGSQRVRAVRAVRGEGASVGRVGRASGKRDAPPFTSVDSSREGAS